MKKYTYEITIEAQDETEADTRMRGLCLLTSCKVIPTQQNNIVLPLAEEEVQLIRYFRKGDKAGKTLQLIAGNFIQNIFPKEKTGEETLKTTL